VLGQFSNLGVVALKQGATPSPLRDADERYLGRRCGGDQELEQVRPAVAAGRLDAKLRAGLSADPRRIRLSSRSSEARITSTRDCPIPSSGSGRRRPGCEPGPHLLKLFDRLRHGALR